MNQPSPFHRPTYPPGFVLGHRKNGLPIYSIAGGSGGNEPVVLDPPLVVPIAPPTATPTGGPNTNPSGAQPGDQVFTAEDIEKARQQEKDKLYGRINEMDERFKKIEGERAAQLAAEEKKRQEAEAAAEAERQKTLTFEQRMAEMEAGWTAKLGGLEQQVQQRDALIEREREFQALTKYRDDAVATNAENIMPELLTWIVGNSTEEIDAAVSRAVETTASILAQVAQAQTGQQYAQQQARQQARGTGVTAPPVGPLENQSGHETFTAADISNMDMATYVKNRGRLLEAASQQMRGRRQG